MLVRKNVNIAVHRFKVIDRSSKVVIKRITYVVRIDFDQSRWFVLSLVLEAEHATVVVNVVVGDTAPQKFNHLILKKHVCTQ